MTAIFAEGHATIKRLGHKLFRTWHNYRLHKNFQQSQKISGRYGICSSALTNLCTILDDAAMFRSFSYHKASHIVDKHQWNFFLIAIHDKSCSFISTESE
jgi:hypothetical protein